MNRAPGYQQRRYIQSLIVMNTKVRDQMTDIWNGKNPSGIEFGKPSRIGSTQDLLAEHRPATIHDFETLYFANHLSVEQCMVEAELWRETVEALIPGVWQSWDIKEGWVYDWFYRVLDQGWMGYEAEMLCYDLLLNDLDGKLRSAGLTPRWGTRVEDILGADIILEDATGRIIHVIQVKGNRTFQGSMGAWHYNKIEKDAQQWESKGIGFLLMNTLDAKNGVMKSYPWREVVQRHRKVKR